MALDPNAAIYVQKAAVPGAMSMRFDKPYYIAGEMVSGHLDVSLDQPVNAKGVNIKWEGVERAKYPVRMYPEIPNAQASMMTHPTRMIFDSDAHLYAAPDGKMAAGKYSFSFQYQLPLTLPSSFHWTLASYHSSFDYLVTAYLDMPNKDLMLGHRLVIGDRVTRNAVPQHVEEKKTFALSFSKGELQMSVDIDKDVFVLGETAKLHVRVVNQSARNVRSIKVRLVLAISHLGSAFSVPFFVRTDMVRYPHKVEGNGGVFEGDLEYKIPLNVYPSSAGQYSTCTYKLCVECDVPMAPDLQALPIVTLVLLPAVNRLNETQPAPAFAIPQIDTKA